MRLYNPGGKLKNEDTMGRVNKEKALEKISTAISDVMKEVKIQVDAMRKGDGDDSCVDAITSKMSQKLYGEDAKVMNDEFRRALKSAVDNLDGLPEKVHNPHLKNEEFDAMLQICTGLKMLKDRFKDMDPQEKGQKKDAHLGQLNKAYKFMIGGLMLLGCALITAVVVTTLPLTLPVSTNVALGVTGFGAFAGVCTTAYGHQLTNTELSKALVEYGGVLEKGIKALEVEMKNAVQESDKGRS